MKRRIIAIDATACTGCGLCVTACHEGAIGLQNGKARLLREDYCDGLGDCLPACPAGAICFEEREAPAYDHAAVLAAQQAGAAPAGALSRVRPAEIKTALSHWPVQLKLTPVKAAAFRNAELLLAADCAAYAHAAFHETFMRGRVTLIGCPKLDGVDYAEKLAAILRENEPRGLTVARMEVPCCGGLEHAARRALAASGLDVPLRVAVLAADGGVLEPVSDYPRHSGRGKL